MAASDIITEDAQPWSSAKGKVHDKLLEGLAAMNYKWMTPVQQKVIFERSSLNSDCLVQAKTGTGKTIAFLIPALHAILTQPRLPRGQVAILIVSPTRELALQIVKECEHVTALVKPRLECHAVYGGSSKERYLKQFVEGDPKIVVATPGRLNDILSDDFIAGKFANLRTLVLDEADQMLEAGFLEAINLILQRLPPKSKGWQGMCFSATIPKKIESVLPKVLDRGFIRLSTVQQDETPTIDLVTQHFVIVPSIRDVYTTLMALLQKEYDLTPQNFKVIVFGTTANNVALMYALFSQILEAANGMRVFQLQSRLSQNARTRTTEEFKAAPAGIMFASDVIGRGMDFPNVSLVVQVGLPSSGEQYVHRVGRTARAGNEGRAIILLTQRESFFLRVNKHLPITQYPTDLLTVGQGLSNNVEGAFANVEPSAKAKAYQAWLGFHKTFTKQLQLTNEGLVEEANEHAAAMGCPEPPAIEKRIIGKMGLKGVRGLNIGLSERNDGNGASNASAANRGGVNRNAANRGGGKGGRGGHNVPNSQRPQANGMERNRNGPDIDAPRRHNGGVRKRGRGAKSTGPTHDASTS